MIIQVFEILLQRKDFFINLVWQHIALTGISVSIAMVVGLLLGILISEYRKLSFLVLGVTNAIYTVPTIALFGMLM